MYGRLIHVGFHNYLDLDDVVAVASPGAAPIKRMVQRSRHEERLIDLTSGRRTKAVIVLDTDRVALVAITPATFHGRATGSQAVIAPNAAQLLVRSQRHLDSQSQ